MMAKFRVIDGTPPPDTPAERVRAKVRKAKLPHLPQCSSCSGVEYVIGTVGKRRAKLCVICLMQGRRREMD